MNEEHYGSAGEGGHLINASTAAPVVSPAYSPTQARAMIAEIGRLRAEVTRLQRELADVRAAALANEVTQLGRTLLVYVLDVIGALLLPQRGQTIIIDLADHTVHQEAKEAQASVGPLQMALERPFLEGAIRGRSGRLTTRYESAIWLPIMHGSDVAVIICLRRAPAQPFSARDQEIGEVLGPLVISALQTGHRLFDLTTDQEALRNLSSTLNVRIRLGGGRVAMRGRDAERLAQGFRLTRDECAAIRLAAILHDIGTVDLTDDLPQKEGPLSADEIIQVREHPAFGAEIVRQIPGMEAVIPLVLHHHERWDGKGYPAGLIAGEIPLGARIVAVVDAFHAMTSPRPYRNARAVDEALHELQLCSGSQFDPRVVDELIRLVREDQVPLG
ncbi:MAG TPA: HD domain-containing phosphohydrolase [Chloroflexota bacterium]|jgi:hypothetical protein|nr:HD domain-containing phosphohydrolase [Chloroflexota bacterium]